VASFDSPVKSPERLRIGVRLTTAERMG